MSVATKLRWETEALHKYTREVAHLGMFELAITKCGPSSIGITVYTGTFSGIVVATAVSFEACEAAILQAAKRELLRAGSELGAVT